MGTSSELLKWETLYSTITKVIFAQVTFYCPYTLPRCTHVGLYQVEEPQIAREMNSNYK